ncbi:unnamed protein product [Amoebophrya sp. A25]|nr:unnamed protein product [Amoebophrya sp. A25]|eukprot:GSA25T00011218001.1
MNYDATSSLVVELCAGLVLQPAIRDDRTAHVSSFVFVDGSHAPQKE